MGQTKNEENRKKRKGKQINHQSDFIDESWAEACQS
jgi:hypothetical protein